MRTDFDEFCFGIFHICKLVKLSKQTINPYENLNKFYACDTDFSVS